MGFGGSVSVIAIKAGDLKAVPFTGDQTGIQAALDYIGSNAGGTVWIGPGTVSGLTGLKMYANTVLRGAGMKSTVLQFTGSGTAIRERNNSGEGNPSGGTGIWIRDMLIQAVGFTGDGINLGNQVGGVQFNFCAGLDSVHVREFTGIGMILRTNAIVCRYIWSNANGTGIQTFGGSSTFFGVFAEGNTTLDLDIQSSNDTFVGVHCEGTTGPSNPFCQIQGFNNCFHDVTVTLTQNRTHIILVKTGYGRNSFFDVGINPATFTFSNLIYFEAWTRGTGAVITEIAQFLDNGVNSSFIYDSSNNTLLTFARGVIAVDRVFLADAATIVVDAAAGNWRRVTLAGNRTMGAPSNATIGQEILFEIIQDGTGGRTLAWNATYIFHTAWTDAGNTANKRSFVAFKYNGTDWRQQMPQTPYTA